MTALTKRIIVGVLAVGVLAVLLVVIVFGVLVGAAIYGRQAAERAGNEAATLQDLKTIAAVEIQYFNAHNRTFGTFEQMTKEEMLTSKFSGSPTSADGYVFTLSITPKSTGRPTMYTLNADPQSTTTGTKYFYIDSNSSTIHFNRDRPANAADASPGE